MAKKNGSRLWLQDGDPSQSSAAAKRTMENCSCSMSLNQIPPRSPDLNTIGFFNIVRCKLNDDALRQKTAKESFEEF